MTHVTKETAVLLKEKGFDLPTDCVYAYSEGDMTISAPTLHEAAYWLREKGMHIFCMQDNYDRWFYMIEFVPRTKKPIPIVAAERYDTHDQALESGIIHALKNYVK